MITDLIFATVGMDLVGFLGWVGIEAYKQSQKPVIEIRKDQWECVETRERTVHILVGKVIVPTVSKECVQYKKSR